MTYRWWDPLTAWAVMVLPVTLLLGIAAQLWLLVGVCLVCVGFVLGVKVEEYQAWRNRDLSQPKRYG